VPITAGAATGEIVGILCHAARVRPALKLGLLPVWRDRDTLQIGIDPRRAVALTGMARLSGVISLLDGSRDRAQLLEAARQSGIPIETADRVLTLLAAGGALNDFPAGTLRVLPQALRAQLAAELATASLARQDSDGGARTLARRRAAYIRIRGTGRIAAAIADLLATAGVGLVSGGANDSGLQPTGLQPANLPGTDPELVRPSARKQTPLPDSSSTAKPAAEHKPHQAAAEHKPHQAAAEHKPRRAPARPPADRALPDLAVLIGHPDPQLSAELMSDRTPHLTAAASEAIGVVGPLVLPGYTACLRCLDLARTDRDPAWPLILAQIVGRQPVPLACDAPLAAAVAAQAAFQALAFIDGADVPDAVRNGTVELVLPSWQWRRRTWLPHPDCCGSSTR
jgi:hypothetical protein